MVAAVWALVSSRASITAYCLASSAALATSLHECRSISNHKNRFLKPHITPRGPEILALSASLVPRLYFSGEFFLKKIRSCCCSDTSHEWPGARLAWTWVDF